MAAIDYNISDTDSLRGRFILNRTGTIDSSGFPSVFYATEPINNYLVDIFGVSYLHGLSSQRVPARLQPS